MRFYFFKANCGLRFLVCLAFISFSAFFLGEKFYGYHLL